MSQHQRTFRLDRLWFRYLQGTELQAHYTVETLADALEELGYIVRLQDRYSETEAFQPFKRQEDLIRVLNAYKEDT